MNRRLTDDEFADKVVEFFRQQIYETSTKNPMTTQEIHDIIQASMEGKLIEQGFPIGRPEWTDFNPDTEKWDFMNHTYRAKPYPREIYMPARRSHTLPKSAEDCRAAYPGEEPVIRFVETPSIQITGVEGHTFLVREDRKS